MPTTYIQHTLITELYDLKRAQLNRHWAERGIKTDLRYLMYFQTNSRKCAIISYITCSSIQVRLND
jgi:hypothetical protein